MTRDCTNRIMKRWTPGNKLHMLANYLRASPSKRRSMLETNGVSREEIDTWAWLYSEYGILGLHTTRKRQRDCSDRNRVL
jgi:hypothetical protein